MARRMRGFTLLEILIAVAVLAIVAVVVLGRTGDALDQAARIEERTMAFESRPEAGCKGVECLTRKHVAGGEASLVDVEYRRHVRKTAGRRGHRCRTVETGDHVSHFVDDRFAEPTGKRHLVKKRRLFKAGHHDDRVD